jgi:SNF2 family DNA or RNA helicase
MDTSVTSNLVRSFYSPSVFRRGEDYYKEGRVKHLSYEKESQIWTAEVIGGKTYQVHISIDDQYIEDDCTCQAYEDCKHVCAVLLAIANEQKPEVEQKNGSKNARYLNAQSLIEFFRDQSYDGQGSMPLSRQPLKVEFLLKTHVSSNFHGKKEQFSIEMKIGMQRLYVVKDIRELLHAILNREELKFGKHFTYDPIDHFFLSEDLEIIKLLIEIYQTENLYNRSETYYWQNTTKKGKDLFIPPFTVENLLMKLKDRDCQYQHQEIVYGQLQISEENLPFSFTLENGKVDGEYQLTFSGGKTDTYYETYGWYSSKGKLYKLTKENQAIMQQFLPLMSNTSSSVIPISSEQIGTFVSRAMPKVKRIGKVKMSEKVAGIITIPPLKVKMFVDGSAERIDVKVEYHYDSIVINPMNQEAGSTLDPKTILVRDEEKERDFMNQLESTSLKVNEHQLYTDTEEDVFEFLYETLEKLEEQAEIYLASSIKSLILPSAAKAKVAVDIQSNGNLLEVDFSMEGIDQEKVPYILQSVIEKKRYVRLPDGAFLSLVNDQLQDVARLYEELNIGSDEIKDGKVRLPVYRGLQVDERLSHLDKQTKKFGKTFRQFLASIKSPEEEDFALPDTLQANLRDYQITGFQWLKSLAHYQLGGILADDMGLGKTLQSIAFILSEKKEMKSNKPFLVVSPASLVYNWKNECSKFAPELQVEIAVGTVQERKAILESGQMPDVFLTSYQTLRQDIEWYDKQEFHALFLDEAQAIKNYASKTAQAVRKIKADKKFALSGTPIENSLDELWSIFETVIPGFFKDQKTFRSLEPEYISRLVKPFILRRLKNDVLKELPDKIETVQHSELTKEQKELYLAYLDQIRTETKESLASVGLGKGRIKILAGLTRLRQLCCHPALFIENYTGQSGKLEQLLEIVENAQENGRRILIFSQFASMLKIIREKLTQEEVSSFYLDGQTPAKDRVQMVDAFNGGEKSIFLISLKAGGTGLNLTGADTVVLYDLWWNPAIEEQAVGRAHRMGQKNVVQVIKMITSGTIEEKINELQQSKKELIDRVIQTGETMLSSLSEADIREILSI